MTAPAFVSPCCGAEYHKSGPTHPLDGPLTWRSVDPDGNTYYMVCSACGQPCDPIEKAVRDRIIAEGMRRVKEEVDRVHARTPIPTFRKATAHEASRAEGWEAACDEVRAAIRREADRLTGKTEGSATDGERRLP